MPYGFSTRLLVLAPELGRTDPSSPAPATTACPGRHRLCNPALVSRGGEPRRILAVVRPVPPNSPHSLAAGPPAGGGKPAPHRRHTEGSSPPRRGAAWGGRRRDGGAAPASGAGRPARPSPWRCQGDGPAATLASLRRRACRCQPWVGNRRFCSGERGLCRTLPDRERSAGLAWLNASRVAPGEAVGEPGKRPACLEGEEREGRNSVLPSPCRLCSRRVFEHHRLLYSSNCFPAKPKPGCC